MKRCSVYFVQAGNDAGPIKIGISADVARRLEELRTGNHLPLTLLASFEVDDAANVERSLHDAFVGLRLEGEWFEHDARIATTIAAWRFLVAERGTAGRAEALRALFPPVTAPTFTGGDELFVVEWSQRQRCIHVDHLADVLSMNQRILLLGEGDPQDYTILAITTSREHARAIADAFDPLLRAMAALRAAGVAR